MGSFQVLQVKRPKVGSVTVQCAENWAQAGYFQRVSVKFRQCDVGC